MVSRAGFWSWAPPIFFFPAGGRVSVCLVNPTGRICCFRYAIHLWILSLIFLFCFSPCSCHLLGISKSTFVFFCRIWKIKNGVYPLILWQLSPLQKKSKKQKEKKSMDFIWNGSPFVVRHGLLKRFPLYRETRLISSKRIEANIDSLCNEPPYSWRVIFWTFFYLSFSNRNFHITTVTIAGGVRDIVRYIWFLYFGQIYCDRIELIS